MKVDLHKFNWPEMFNDSKGRTSPGKVLGFFGGIVSIITFLIAGLAIITKYGEGSNIEHVLMYSVALFYAAAALLGIRRFTKDKDLSETQQPDA